MTCRVYERELPSTKPPPPEKEYPARLPKPQRLPSGIHRLQDMWIDGQLSLSELGQAYRALQETEREETPCR